MPTKACPHENGDGYLEILDSRFHGNDNIYLLTGSDTKHCHKVSYLDLTGLTIVKCMLGRVITKPSN